MQKNVEKYLEMRANDLAEEWSNMAYLDSYNEYTPIEALFIIEWKYQTAFQKEYMPLFGKYKEKIFFIYPQYEIEITENRKYRVDFLIEYKYMENWEKNDKEDMFIIEMDSYLWHGSTPEQFAKEKKRERNLISAGYKIIRFSGREVYRNPEKCVDEVMDYIYKNEKNRIK